MCEAVLLPYGTSDKQDCQLKSLYYRASFDGFRFISHRFLVIHTSPQKNQGIKQLPPVEPLLWHCYFDVVGGLACLNDPEGDANWSFGS
jgi:hypothetical protein